jgi:type VI protein secretion system component VasF
LDELPAVNDAFQALNQMPQTVLMQNQSYGSSRSHYRNSSEMPLWVYIAGAALAALVVIFILMVVSR